MKAHLNSYLSKTPNSSLNVFRDLLASDLERRASLELQKFSVDFNKLTDEQKVSFLIELDKALTNINIMRGIVADIKKEAQEEAARDANYEALAIAARKKEEEEAKERKALESLGSAIEMAALKTSASVNSSLLIPGLDSTFNAVDALNKQYVQTSKVLDDQLIQVTEMLLSKIKVVENPNSILNNTPYMDEFGNISPDGVLINALRYQANVDILAVQFGIHPREMHKLAVVGEMVIFDGQEDRFVPFADIDALFRSSTRDNATSISPIMLSSEQGIRLAKEKARNETQYFDAKINILETGIEQCIVWRVKILQERGVTVDSTRIDEQLAEVARNESQSFVERLVAERAAFELLNRDLAETKASRETQVEHNPFNFLEELKQRRELRQTTTNDRSSPMLEMYRANKAKFADSAVRGRPISPDEVNEPSDAKGYTSMPILPRR